MEKTGRKVFLGGGDITKIDLTYSVMPFLVMVEAFLAWLVFGWHDIPLWTVWYAVFAMERPMSLVMHGLNHLYGYQRLSEWTLFDWLSRVLDVLAWLISILCLTFGEVGLNLYWRMQVIGYFVLVACLAAWVFRRCFWDYQSWQESEEFQKKNYAFREYVKAVNAEASEETSDEQTSE